MRVSDTLLRDLTEALVETVHPRQVVLFGSRARGDATVGSDVDLLVVEDDPFDHRRSRHDELRRLRAAVSRFRIPRDILVCSHAEAEQWRHSLNHVIAKAYREGSILYGRD